MSKGEFDPWPEETEETEESADGYRAVEKGGGRTVLEFDLGDALRVDYSMNGMHTGEGTARGVVERIGTNPDGRHVDVWLTGGWWCCVPDGPILKDNRKRGTITDVRVLFRS